MEKRQFLKGDLKKYIKKRVTVFYQFNFIELLKKKSLVFQQKKSSFLGFLVGKT